MSIMLLLWSKLELALRLTQVMPTINIVDAFAHASAAVDAADQGITAELLLGMAYVESRFDPTATSRIEGTVRRTGSYPSRAAPRNLRGTLYCGPLQAYASSWQGCLAMRDLTTGYTAGAGELKRWSLDVRVRGNITRVLLGHGCGNYGLKVSQCNGYPSRVLDFARRLNKPARPARSLS